MASSVGTFREDSNVGGRRAPGETPEQSYREAQAVLEAMSGGGAAGPALSALQGLLERKYSRDERGPGRKDETRVWAAELRYRALVENIPAVTFMAALDESVHELYVSPQIERLLGFTQEEWLQDPFLWYSRLHPEDRERWHSEFARTCATGVHFKSQYRFLARDGHVVWVQGEAQIVHDEAGRPLFLQGIAFDITEIKRAEEALQRTHEQLEIMVAQRTRELALANESLRQEIARRQELEQELQERARQLADESERKDHFLAVLAHELRNPLAPITMALEVIRRGSASPDDLQWAQGMMERQVRHMSRLIDDLLDISRINRGKVELKLELIDIRAVVKRAAETARPRVQERQHEFALEVTEVPLWVQGDSVRLEQVLVNLLTNAAKFTDPGGRIALHAEREREEVVVRVSDTGAGIPPHMLEGIFELFAQIDRSTSRSNQWGLGIGLALVRGLVELHGGRVRALSEGPGRGSEFIVRLPLAQAAREPAARGDTLLPGPTTLGPLPRRPILVVDDHREFAQALAMLLRTWGQDVQVANDGEQALQRVKEQPFDVVLLDIGMPGLDGFEVVRRMRSTALPHATIVALTGYGRPEDLARAAESGFTNHITKPVAPLALHALLASIPPRGQAEPSP